MSWSISALFLEFSARDITVSSPLGENIQSYLVPNFVQFWLIIRTWQDWSNTFSGQYLMCTASTAFIKSLWISKAFSSAQNSWEYTKMTRGWNTCKLTRDTWSSWGTGKENLKKEAPVMQASADFGRSLGIREVINNVLSSIFQNSCTLVL